MGSKPQRRSEGKLRTTGLLEGTKYRFAARHLKAPKAETYSVKAKVWLYSGMAAWHFVTIPVKTSKDIKKKFGYVAKGWGSLPVTVKLGRTQWRTSIFPDKKAGAYVLPLKADVRKKENVKAQAVIAFRLMLA